MEKTTLYTRQGIIDALNVFIPKVINTSLKMVKQLDESFTDKDRDDIKIDVLFGEYDSPSFDSQIETISKARTNGVMSTETSVKELYGDSKDETWINEEVIRIKEEQGIVSMEEPAINSDKDIFNDQEDLDETAQENNK